MVLKLIVYEIGSPQGVRQIQVAMDRRGRKSHRNPASPGGRSGVEKGNIDDLGTMLGARVREHGALKTLGGAPANPQRLRPRPAVLAHGAADVLPRGG